MDIETAITEILRDMREAEPGEAQSDAEVVAYVRKHHLLADARDHGTSYVRRAYALVIGATDEEVAEVLNTLKAAVERVLRDFRYGNPDESAMSDVEVVAAVRASVGVEFVRSIEDAELRRAYSLVAGATDAEIDAALA